MPVELFQSIEIETLSFCNMRCGTCPVSLHPRQRQAMSTEVFRSVVDELAAVDYAGAFSPHFFNEPFADERLPELMDYAVRQLPRATFHIFTNTTLLDRRLLSRMPKAIRSYVVSIDNDIIRHSYERLMAELDTPERALFFPRSISDGKLYNRGGSAPAQPGLRKVARCRVPAHYCCVSANGDVPLCYNDYFGEHVLGNVNKTPLLEIWGSQHFQDLRRTIAEGRHAGLICARCTSNIAWDKHDELSPQKDQDTRTDSAGVTA